MSCRPLSCPQQICLRKSPWRSGESDSESEGSDLESLSSAATSEDDPIQWDEGAVYPEELPFSSEQMVRNSNSGVVHFLRTPGYTACGRKVTGYFSEFDGAKMPVHCKGAS